MTSSIPSLMLGGARIRVYDREVGQVKGSYVERAVTKASHDTNFGLEFRTDHVIAIKTAYTVGWTFEEMQPPNANLLVGAPGYSIVPQDRSLPGGRISPALLTYGNTRRKYTEYVRMLRDRTVTIAPAGVVQPYPGIWHGLLYPIATLASGAMNPVQISVFNTDFTGTLLDPVTGYVAVAISVMDGIGAESLPSNIEYAPLSAADDDLSLTWIPNAGPLPIAGKYTIYQGPVSRNANTQLFTHTGPFQDLTGKVKVAWPTANGDGSYTITWKANVVPLTNEPVCPIDVSLFDDATQTWVKKSWPEDFQYETKKNGGGLVRLSPVSALDPAVSPAIVGLGGGILKVDYYYDIKRIRELPLDASGRNPIVPVTLEVLFPDMDSKMIWHFFRAQVNTNMRFATNDNDWYGQDFVCETLDDSNLHPAYGFGYVQLVGDNLVDEIHRYNNLPFGINQALGSNQTSYA